jgi:hypothetical protein
METSDLTRLLVDQNEKTFPSRSHGDGTQSRDFMFVANAVLASLLATGVRGEASERRHVLGDLHATVAA